MNSSPRRTARARSARVKREPGHNARPRFGVWLNAARRSDAPAWLLGVGTDADAVRKQRAERAVRKIEAVRLHLEFRGIFYRRVTLYVHLWREHNVLQKSS